MARPFRLTAPEPSELDLHETVASLLDRCLIPPAFWFAYPAGHVQLSAAEVARLVRIGLKRSLPDIWILHNGVYCIELKREGGELSRTFIKRTKRGAPRVYVGQEEIFPRLIATGSIEAIAVCTSVDEVCAQCAIWHIPLRIAA